MQVFRAFLRAAFLAQNKAGGLQADCPCTAAGIDRAGWERINFDALENVDPIEALEAIDLRLDMTKACIMRAVEPFS